MRDIIQLAMGCLCVAVLATGDVVAQDGWPLQYDGTPIDSLVADSNNTRTVAEAACGDFRRGDLNGNGVAYEIADAVMFTNYFVNGLAAFAGHVRASIAASDVNRDGIPLSVADLVYLVRVIIGDILPYEHIRLVDARITFRNGVMSVDRPMGAAYVVIAGDVTPTLLANNMEMKYAFNGQNTNILVYSLDGNSFVGDFLWVDGEVVRTEFATDSGQPVTTNSMMSPSFELAQNYPNPFNLRTRINYALYEPAHIRIEIYNVAGQKIRTLVDKIAAAEYGSALWDGRDVANEVVSSGPYFCRVTVNDSTQTLKMMLLK
jgi:hypothetical protein